MSQLMCQITYMDWASSRKTKMLLFCQRYKISCNLFSSAIRPSSPMIEVSTARVVQKAINTEPALSFTFFLLPLCIISSQKRCKRLDMFQRCSFGLFCSQLRVKSSRCHLGSHHCISSNAFSYQCNRASYNEGNIELKQ